MARGHASFFSYKLSRPYPFRWFTPVVVVGGILLTALFSVLNYAANGYVLGSTFVADPNSTLAEKAWFEKPPLSYQSRLSASCQPANIAPGTQLTANSGLQYTLGNVWTDDGTGVVALPSLTYLNNSFTNCKFQGIQICLVNYDPESNGPHWTWKRDSSATVSIDRHVHLNLSITVKGALQMDPGKFGYEFLTAKRQTQASLWFGQLLMYVRSNGGIVPVQELTAFRWKNFNQILNQMAQVNETQTGIITGVGIYVAQNPGTSNTDESSVLQDDFMTSSDQTTGYAANYGIVGGSRVEIGNPPIVDTTIGEINVGRAVDYFAKSLYSFVLADLGQRFGPNVLADSGILDEFWTACSNEIFQDAGYGFAALDIMPMRSFDTLKNTTGPIGISKATLNAQYLCQIPHRKDTGSILVAVIVADLVLLQAAWKLFSWITTFWLEKKDPEAKFCSGCAAKLGPPLVGTEGGGVDRLRNSYEMSKGSFCGSRGSHYAKVLTTQVGTLAGDGAEEPTTQVRVLAGDSDEETLKFSTLHGPT
ncbi:hypothetical protein AYO22_04553 [Fonsecaea multimorphosa]|nr:hypothetical protein AYO22_04553 [Fonsecaea multimorphosa]